MSQNKVYEALLEIGEECTTSELKEVLKEKYPDSTIDQYAATRLRQLEEKGVVELDDSKKPFDIRVVNDTWEGIPESNTDKEFPGN